ncbi:MAG: hypothetical protein ChlgKO_06170 [Chlamydiales bacterium]
MIRESFRKEICENILRDSLKIQSSFELIGDLREVIIKPSEGETHFGGKKAVFLTILSSKEEKVKVVYKPRSILPEKYLEECLFNINEKKLETCWCAMDMAMIRKWVDKLYRRNTKNLVKM